MFGKGDFGILLLETGQALAKDLGMV